MLITPKYPQIGFLFGGAQAHDGAEIAAQSPSDLRRVLEKKALIAFVPLSCASVEKSSPIRDM